MKPKKLHKRLKYACWRWGDYLIGNMGIDQYKTDCSCGCKYFIELNDDAGADWGVCINPMSERRGMLTFEHMGCFQFKAEKEVEND